VLSGTAHLPRLVVPRWPVARCKIFDIGATNLGYEDNFNFKVLLEEP